MNANMFPAADAVCIWGMKAAKIRASFLRLNLILACSSFIVSFDLVACSGLLLARLEGLCSYNVINP